MKIERRILIEVFMIETIIAAALRYEQTIPTLGTIENPAVVYKQSPMYVFGPPPVRHGDLFKFGHTNDQGFITSTGRFVGREEAKQIVLASGQPLTEHGEMYRDKPHLFSEDLW